MGLLGTGFWARHTQAAALAAHPGVEFAGVWGRDAGKAEALAGDFGVRAYDDLDALFADVDGIAVAVPPDVQGKHLLLDKPLALTVEAADRIVDAVTEKNLASLVFFTNRFAPVQSAFLAEQALVGGWYAAHGTHYASIFEPGNPYGESPWRRERGGLWDVGPHGLSIVLPLLGAVEEVSAVDGARQSTHLLLRHAGGAASTLSLTLDAAPGATTHVYNFFGENGAATLPDGKTPPDEIFGMAAGQLIELAGQSSPQHPCDVHFGRSVVAVLAAAEIARAERRIVKP
jgi:predicted dehydrogenase